MVHRELLSSIDHWLQCLNQSPYVTSFGRPSERDDARSEPDLTEEWTERRERKGGREAKGRETEGERYVERDERETRRERGEGGERRRERYT